MARYSDFANGTVAFIGQKMFGLDEVSRLSLVALYTDGHVLLEGNPGSGKTEFVKCLANCLRLETGRIQFTPDLMPTDVTGTEMPEFGEGGVRKMEYKKGPIFTSLLLADEINRATPKTQAAMLEAMAERQVTVLGVTRELGHPFMVLATQNPIDQEGTYNLPEAQADRFMFKINMPSSSREVIRKIVDKVSSAANGTETESRDAEATDEEKEQSRRNYQLLREEIKKVQIIPAVYTHIENLFLASHGRLEELNSVENKRKARLEELARLVHYGLGPRAAIAQGLASKAWALFFLSDPQFATAQCLGSVVIPTLRHRLKLDPDWANIYAPTEDDSPRDEDQLRDQFLAEFAATCAPGDDDYARSFQHVAPIAQFLNP